MFHNPGCSKSRGALEILVDRGVDVDVVEYLKAPPIVPTLERIVDAIPDEPAALVRNDKRFAELGSRSRRLRDAATPSSTCSSSTPSSWSGPSCSWASAP